MDEQKVSASEEEDRKCGQYVGNMEKALNHLEIEEDKLPNNF